MALGVVLEGPDGSGKTTLAKRLRNEFGWPVIHVVQPGRPDITQMLRLLDVGSAVFDRFHLSPIAYGKVLRSGPELDWQDNWALEGKLTARGFVTVVCCASVSTMVANNRRQSQLFREVCEPETVHRLAAEYLQRAAVALGHCLLYDYELETEDGLLQRLSRLERATTPYGVQGTARPARWLVGDLRKDPPIDPYSSIPFYGPGSGGKWLSSTLLSRAMLELRWLWRNTALSNSRYLTERDEQPITVELSEYYEELGRPKVIALGHVAAARLSESEVPYTQVPHPQFWRRFHARDVEGYVQLLREAAAC